MRRLCVFILCFFCFQINSAFSQDVLLLYADGYNSDVYNKVQATGLFNSVQLFDGRTGTPTLAYLQNFDAVLVWSNTCFADPVAIGTVLVSYVDNGGGVVTAVFTNFMESCWGDVGAFDDPPYSLAVNGTYASSQLRTLGTVHLPSHPIMTGVNDFSNQSNPYVSTVSLYSGTVKVADYNDGTPLIYINEDVGPKHARRAELNFFPPSSDARSDFWSSNTDGGLLMANALLWVANDQPILSGVPADETVECDAVPAPPTVTATDNQDGSLPVNFSEVRTDGACVNTYILTRSWSATDSDGNTTTETQSLSVVDNTAPVISGISSPLTEVAAASACEAVVNFPTITASDNCGAASLSFSHASGSIFPVGETTVTVTATDECGNVGTANFLVVVEDNVPPTVVTQNITVQLDGNGTATITPEQINNGSSDACGIASMSLDVTSFNCSNVGTNTVTLTVTDVNNNVSTGTATVTVEDNEAPVVVTQNITVQLDNTGNATITPEQIDNGSSDACGIASMSLDITSFTCANVGANTVTLTVMDVNGNQSTGTATVTVEDVTAPTVVTQNITVALDEVGNASITPAQVNNGSSDNCGIASLALSKSSFNCSDIGSNTVTLSVTDVNGNTGYGTATVEVTGEVTISGLAASYCEDAQEVTLTLSPSGGILSGPGVTGNIFNPAQAGPGTHTLTYSLVGDGTTTDEYTLNQSGSFAPVAGTGTSVSLSDDVISPALSIGFDFSFYGNSYSQFYISSNGFITFSPFQDNGCCSGRTIPTAGMNPSNMIAFAWNDLYPSNGGEVNYFTTGTAPNRKLVVNFINVPHYVSNPPPVTTQLIIYEGTNVIEIHSTDNGSDGTGQTMGIMNADGSQGVAVPGRNASTWHVYNDFVQFIPVASSCVTTETVTVIPEITITCPENIEVVSDVNACGTAVAFGATASGDPDPTITYTIMVEGVPTTINSGHFFPIGETVVTATASNGTCDTKTCSFTVNVLDRAPVVVTQNITVQLNAGGTASIAPEQIDNGSYDNCSIASIALDVSSFSCDAVGTPQTVTLSVTDNNGNVSTGTATVTVEDNVAPVVATRNITVQLNASGAATITPEQIDNGSSDACGFSLSLDKVSFTCSDVGANTVTLTVTDENGNVSTGTATVTVEDNVVPVVVTQNITVQLDETGNATIAPEQIDNGSSDACGIASMSLDVSSFSCATIGANTVTLTVTDNNGNVSTGTATVTVEDNIAPVVSSVATYTIGLNEAGNATLSLADVLTAASTDACGIASEVLSKTSFSCADIANNPVQVTLSVTDNNNNVTTTTIEVTVEDTIAPVVATQNITVLLDETGNATITPEQIDNRSSDACGIASMSLDKTSFTCADIVNNPVQVILTVTDTNGNVSTGTATVTVEDNVVPVVVTRNITVQLDVNGAATIAPEQIDNGSSDACGIASMSLDVSSFSCATIGANTVTLTVTDVNGNVSTGTATVTVEDNVVPVVVTQNITVQLDETGNATIAPEQIDNGSSDACGVSLALDVTSFNCEQIGTNTVTLTVTDNSGNVSTATATVTVEDNVAPVVVTRDVTIQLDALGAAAVSVADIDNGSSDACGIASMELDVTSFGCGAVRTPHTVTLTVTDNNGNVSTGTAIVTVEDPIAPSLLARDVSLVLNASGQATLTEAAAVVSKDDNCPDPAISFSQTVFGCENAGTPVAVTVTATDAAGNRTDQLINVTVIDETAPVAIAQNILLALDENGEASLSAAAIDGGSYDNCTFEMSIDRSSFGCEDTGVHTVTLTITDVAGQTATATAEVRVVDETAPIVEGCPEDVVAGIRVAETYEVPDFSSQITASDNCTVGSITQLPAAGTILSELGAHTVQLKVADGAGNETLCSFTITLEHRNTAPAGLELSAAAIEEHQAEGTFIANFSTVDVDREDTHSYVLASGEGSEDNALFFIEGSELKSAMAYDFELKKRYTIRVATVDAEGERFEQSFTIDITDIEDTRVYMPNLFSPNNDGSNDTFRVRANGVENIRFRIFNRWGVMVYEASSVEEATVRGWDGTYKGKEQPTGTYVWQIGGQFTDGEPLLFEGKSNGNITLIR